MKINVHDMCVYVCVCMGGGRGDYLPLSFTYRLAREDGPQREIKECIIVCSTPLYRFLGCRPEGRESRTMDNTYSKHTCSCSGQCNANPCCHA